MNSLFYFKILITCLGLNIIAPNLASIAKGLSLEKNQGLLVIGGLDYFLIYFPMGISSILLFFSKRRLPIDFSICSIFIGMIHILIYFVNEIYLFHSFNLLIGLSYGLFFPLAYEYLKKIANSDQQMQSVGKLNISIGIGLALGQYISGYLGEISPLNGWRLTYLTIGLFILFSSLFRVNSKFRSSDIKLENTKSLVSVVKDKYYLFLLLQYVPGSIPWGGITVFLFPYLQDNFNFSKLGSVNILIIIALGMLAGTYFASVIGDKLKNDRKIYFLIQITLIISQIIVFLLLFSIQKINGSALYLLIFICGILLAFPGTYIKGLLFKNLDEANTRIIFSMENFLESIGKGLGPLVIGFFIYSSFEMSTSIVLATLFWNLCIFLIYFAFKSRST